MQRYARGRLLAQGVFGDVYEAWDGETSTHVAVKHVREPSPAALRAAGGGGGGGPSREAAVQGGAPAHANVLPLLAVVRHGGDIFLVSPLLATDVAALVAAAPAAAAAGALQPPSAALIARLARGLFAGLASLHAAGIVHRVRSAGAARRARRGGTSAATLSAPSPRPRAPQDIKPANLLLAADGGLVIGDFGLARRVPAAARGGACAGALPPLTAPVASRWYRPPELLLGAAAYDGAAVDAWAAGAVLAELFELSPLAAGGSDAEQLAKLVRARGAPAAPPLSALLPCAPPVALALVDALLSWDPARRPSAAAALEHPWLRAAAADARGDAAAACELRRLVAFARAAAASGGRGGARFDADGVFATLAQVGGRS
jgi:serine/threonine protein kinase